MNSAAWRSKRPQRSRAGRLLEAVYLRDVRVVERCQHLRFTLEPRQAVAIVGEMIRQDLDRDVALQPAVAGPVDLAHAAGAKRRDDFIWTDVCAGGERHVGERDGLYVRLSIGRRRRIRPPLNECPAR